MVAPRARPGHVADEAKALAIRLRVVPPVGAPVVGPGVRRIVASSRANLAGANGEVGGAVGVDAGRSRTVPAEKDTVDRDKGLHLYVGCDGRELP